MRPFLRVVLIISFLLALGPAAVWPQALMAAAPSPQQPFDTLSKPGVTPAEQPVSATTDPSNRVAQEAPPTGPIVGRIYYTNKADLDRLATVLDIWEVNRVEGYALALLSPQRYAMLLAAGYRIEIDQAQTEALLAPRQMAPGQTTGIPGYPCYRTVEETYNSMAALAAAHPDLATWTDIGDSWDKVTPGGPAGYDLYELTLTNKGIPGPKPRFFLMAAIHAREYTTAELAARYVEKLVADYGVDADTTWLLDRYELHVVFQANPDGRKKAEAGDSWRKNTDNDDGCTASYPQFGYTYGTDLNRNSTFKWGMGGSSGDACSETYRGPAAGSEPEVQTLESRLRALFADQRGPGDTDPAPATTEGLMITLHSYSQLVLFPWGWTSSQQAPNHVQLQTLGRKFGFYNGYEVCAAGPCLYTASGTTDDFAYGDLGIAAYTFELGTAFFQSCSAFENDVLPRNLPALKYAFKVARRPYQDPAGPEVINAVAGSGTITRGTAVTITATADDGRFNSNGHGIEPTQNVAAARYTVDVPSWQDGTPHPMSAADGSFNAPAEGLTASMDTTAWAPGRHILFIEAQDTNGQWGVPTAVFLTIESPCMTPLPPANLTAELHGTTVSLAWVHVAANDAYEVWRSAQPYFLPGDPNATKIGDVLLTGTMTLTFDDPNGAGDPAANHFYIVRGTNACAAASEPGPRIAAFSFALTAGN